MPPDNIRVFFQTQNAYHNRTRVLYINAGFTGLYFIPSNSKSDSAVAYFTVSISVADGNGAPLLKKTASDSEYVSLDIAREPFPITVYRSYQAYLAPGSYILEVRCIQDARSGEAAESVTVSKKIAFSDPTIVSIDKNTGYTFFVDTDFMKRGVYEVWFEAYRDINAKDMPLGASIKYGLVNEKFGKIVFQHKLTLQDSELFKPGEWRRFIRLVFEMKKTGTFLIFVEDDQQEKFLEYKKKITVY